MPRHEPHTRHSMQGRIGPLQLRWPSAVARRGTSRLGHHMLHTVGRFPYHAGNVRQIWQIQCNVCRQPFVHGTVGIFLGPARFHVLQLLFQKDCILQSFLYVFQRFIRRFDVLDGSVEGKRDDFNTPMHPTIL